jgi:DNA-binding MarR family transcriptional regulator
MILSIVYSVTVSPSRPHRPVAFQLSQLGGLAGARFSAAVAPLGLSAAEAGVLRLLARAPGISQRALAVRLGAGPSRVVVLIDSLEKAGLVVRKRSATDRRHHELRLTEAGTTTLAQLRGVAERHDRDLLAPLTAVERTQLADLLEKLSRGHDLDPEVHPGQASS